MTALLLAGAIGAATGVIAVWVALRVVDRLGDEDEEGDARARADRPPPR